MKKVLFAVLTLLTFVTNAEVFATYIRFVQVPSSDSLAITYEDGSTCNCDSLELYMELVDDSSGGYAIISESPYLNGMKNGRDRGYYSTGEDLYSYISVNGLREGEYKVWHKNGQLKERTNYKLGAENGLHEYFNDLGYVTNAYAVKDGHRHGKSTSYYEGTWVLEVVVTYSNGLANGMTTWYNVDGSLEQEKMRKGGKDNGLTTWYFPNGKVAGTAMYKNDAIVGYKTCVDGRKGNEHLDCLQ